jgi:hypothetical protein
MRHRIFRPALAVLGAALALAGCNTQRVTLCPGAAILADAAIRPVLRPGTVNADPSALLYTVEMTGVEQSCSLDTRAGEANSDIRLTFRATRAPTGQPARQVVPYFVAVNQGERIITKRAMNITLDFPAGAAVVTFSTAIDSSVLKMENGRLPTDYQYLAGLEMNAAERGYLQARSRSTP